MELDIIVEEKIPRGYRTVIRRSLSKICQIYNVQSAFTIVLSNSAKLRKLKQEHWGEDEPTDVLSFPLYEPGDPFMPSHLGDIFISLETAARQAVEHQHALIVELIILSTHGLLHLLGFDHDSPAAWQRFHEAESEAQKIALVESAHLPSVYVERR